MFLKVYAENLYGISEPISIDFISKSRNKESLKTVFKTHDNVYISKILGIIGGNASGKTSIINTIATIGGIITSPILDTNIGEKIEQLKKAMDVNSSDKDIIIDLLKRIDSSINLNIQNVTKSNKSTIIEVELYITDIDESMTGYYKYKVEFNGYEDKLINEYFSFRKNYSNKEEVIIDIKDIRESQIHYMYRYFNNIANELNIENRDKLLEKYKYCKVFREHYINNSSVILTGEEIDYKELKLIEWFKKSPKMFKSLVKVVDEKLKDVILEENNSRQELYFVMQSGDKISQKRLSTGTERFLNIAMYIVECINNKGILIIDEIEQNFNLGLIEFMINMINEIVNSETQIIFTTHREDIFDIIDVYKKKIFKQDSIYVIDNIYNKMVIDRLSKLYVDGKKIKNDALFSNLYKKKKISCHPNKKEMIDFLQILKEEL